MVCCCSITVVCDVLTSSKNLPNALPQHYGKALGNSLRSLENQGRHNRCTKIKQTIIYFKLNLHRAVMMKDGTLHSEAQICNVLEMLFVIYYSYRS